MMSLTLMFLLGMAMFLNTYSEFRSLHSVPSRISIEALHARWQMGTEEGLVENDAICIETYLQYIKWAAELSRILYPSGKDEVALTNRATDVDETLPEKRVHLGMVLFFLFELLEHFPRVPELTFRFQENDLAVDALHQLIGKYRAEKIFDILMEAAELGHPQAQHLLATAYATGLLNGREGIVPMDAGRSLILEYMAALAGNPEANMGMGYRFAHGIGVIESCDKALMHYEVAANVAINEITNRGYSLFIDNSYLTDVEKYKVLADNDPEVLQYYRQLAEEGDTQACVTLGKMFVSGNRVVQQNYTLGVQYLKKASEAGSVQASGQLGYLLAQRIPEVVASPTGKSYASQEIVELLKYSSRRGDSNGEIGWGYIHLKGIGVEKNVTKALEVFQRLGDKHVDASFWTGEMLAGPGFEWQAGETNARTQKEEEFLQNDPPLLGIKKNGVQWKPDYQAAAAAYSLAAQKGHVIALHRLSHMIKRGLGASTVCPAAMHGFKSVAEKGDWGAAITTAHRLFDQGKKEDSLRIFARLAAIGYEPAQFNAAYLLSSYGGVLPKWVEPDYIKAQIQSFAESGEPELHKNNDVFGRPVQPHLRLLWRTGHKSLVYPESYKWVDASTGLLMKPLSSDDIKIVRMRHRDHLDEVTHKIDADGQGEDFQENFRESSNITDHLPYQNQPTTLHASRKKDAEARALSLYALSAGQGNPESHTRIGDFHYYGKGWLPVDKQEASLFYQSAADLHHTRATFNLGVMHQLGDGVEQDFHLAKRYYDQAAEFNHEAKVPRTVALFLLSFHKQSMLLLGQKVASDGVHIAANIAVDLEKIIFICMDYMANYFTQVPWHLDLFICLVCLLGYFLFVILRHNRALDRAAAAGVP